MEPSLPCPPPTDLDFCALEFHMVLTVTHWCPEPPFFEFLNLAVIYRLTSHKSEKLEFKTGLLLLWVEDRIDVAGGQRGPTKPTTLSKCSQTPWFHSQHLSAGGRGTELLRAISLPTVSSLEPHSSPARLGRVVGEEIK